MLVTGAAGGLGQAIVAAATAAGYRVGSYDLAPVDGVESYVGSVSDPTAVAAALDQFGTPDVVVNNAGIVRFAALDGRLPDLDTNPPPALVPLVSDNWTKFFQWRGAGALPEPERAKLRQIVARTHAQGKRLRLWAAPDNEAGWKELLEAGVDLINTDKLAELETFLRAQEPPR